MPSSNIIIYNDLEADLKEKGTSSNNIFVVQYIEWEVLIVEQGIIVMLRQEVKYKK